MIRKILSISSLLIAIMFVIMQCAADKSTTPAVVADASPDGTWSLAGTPPAPTVTFVLATDSTYTSTATSGGVVMGAPETGRWAYTLATKTIGFTPTSGTAYTGIVSGRTLTYTNPYTQQPATLTKQ